MIKGESISRTDLIAIVAPSCCPESESVCAAFAPKAPPAVLTPPLTEPAPVPKAVVTTTLSVKFADLTAAVKTALSASMKTLFAAEAGVKEGAVKIALQAAMRRLSVASRALATGETLVLAEITGEVNETMTSVK